MPSTSPGTLARRTAAIAALWVVALIWIRPGPKLFIGTDAAAYARLAQELCGRPVTTWAALSLSAAGETTPFYEHPPGYFWCLAAVFRLFGSSTAVAVALARTVATCSVAAVATASFLLLGWRGVAASLVGLALLPSFVFESQNVMLEGPLSLGLALCVCGLLLQARRVWAGTATFAVGFCIAWFCKGIFAVAALAWLACLPSPRAARQCWRPRLIAAAAALGGAAVLWAGFELWRHRLGLDAFLPHYLRRQVVFSLLHGAYPQAHSADFYLRPLWRWFFPAVVASGVWLRRGTWRAAKPEHRRLARIGLVYVGTLICGLYCASRKNQWYVHACIPGFAWLCGAACLQAAAKLPRALCWRMPQVLTTTLAVYLLICLAWPRLLATPRPALEAIARLPPPSSGSAVPSRVANCSHLSAWRTRYLFAFYWNARALACGDGASTHTFDGRTLRPVTHATLRAP